MIRRIPPFDQIAVKRLSRWIADAQVFSVPPGEELQRYQNVDNSWLVVFSGGLEWCADLTLTQNEDPETDKSRRKLNIYIEAGLGLTGGSFLDRLDPYVVGQLSAQKKFRTKTLNNAGKDPYFDHNCQLVYDNEPGIEFFVYDHDKYMSDALTGIGFIPADQFVGSDGFEGEVRLRKPPSTNPLIAKLSMSKSEGSAGVLLVRCTWGKTLGFKSVTQTKEPRRRSWWQQAICDIPANSAFGHENLLLREQFINNLCRATNSVGYKMFMGNFSLRAKTSRGRLTNTQVLRVPRASFLHFIQRMNVYKDIMANAINSSVEKQLKLREICNTLITKWGDEDRRTEQMRNARALPQVGIDVTMLRTALRGATLVISVHNGMNLNESGWFDKLDPYLIISLLPGRRTIKSGVYENAGKDPFFDYQGRLQYSGEASFEIQVMDRDKFTKDDVVGKATLGIEQFHDGFEGTLELKRPGTATKKAGSAGQLSLTVEWENIPEIGAP